MEVVSDKVSLCFSHMLHVTIYHCGIFILFLFTIQQLYNKYLSAEVMMEELVIFI